VANLYDQSIKDIKSSIENEEFSDFAFFKHQEINKTLQEFKGQYELIHQKIKKGDKIQIENKNGKVISLLTFKEALKVYLFWIGD